MSYEPINLISIAIVAYNEEESISAILEDIVAQDFPLNKIELLLIDSGSTDATREVMASFASCEKAIGFANVRVLENPKKILPAGCNMAIESYSGDALVRLDAHARIPVDFISQSVAVLNEGEFVCGGPRPVIAFPNTAWAETLLLAEGSAFGSSIADYRGASEREYVSAAFHATFRREVIERVGLYDERLVRTEDNDYFYRVRKAGYKVRFDGRICSEQIARNTLKRMLKQKYGNGYWIGRTLFIQPKCFHMYHFAPLVFVLGVLTMLVIGVAATWIPFVACGLLYAAACVVLSLKAMLEASRKHACMLVLPFVFMCIHVSYGLGTALGLVKGFFVKKGF